MSSPRTASRCARAATTCRQLPFHKDEHPSFAVYPETRSFYCFGCNAGGDVIDFVRRADNLSFRDALERLSNGQAPTPPTRLGPNSCRSTTG